MAHSKPNTPDFGTLIASRPVKEAAHFTMDMSAFFPEKVNGAPILFTYRPLRINQVFALEELILLVKRQRPEWSDKQCLEVAGLVACHVDPPARAGASAEENRAMLPALYCNLFDVSDDTDLFVFLAEFAEKSGGFLKNLQTAVTGAKKNSSPPEERAPSAPSTSA